MAKNAYYQFLDAIVAEGWIEVGLGTFQKSKWKLFFDTSSWMELYTFDNRRIFDVPVPTPGYGGNAAWTISLIEHLFTMNDKLEQAGKSLPNG